MKGYKEPLKEHEIKISFPKKCYIFHETSHIGLVDITAVIALYSISLNFFDEPHAFV